MFLGMGKHCPVRKTIKVSSVILMASLTLGAIAILAWPSSAEQQSLLMRALSAEKQVKEWEDVVNGRKMMVDVELREYAEVKWHKYKEIRR